MVKKHNRQEARLRRHARIRAKISGTSTKPRMSVYRSNKTISVQLIDDTKGVTICSASSVELNATNNNVETSKLVGEAFAKKAIAAGIEDVVFDRGGFIYHGKIKALADAAREAGLKF